MAKPSDGHLAKMVDGKARKQAAIIWTLDMGEGFAFRCAPKGDGYAVEVRSGGGWGPFATGRDPLELLRKLTNTETLRHFLRCKC